MTCVRVDRLTIWSNKTQFNYPHAQHGCQYIANIIWQLFTAKKKNISAHGNLCCNLCTKHLNGSVTSSSGTLTRMWPTMTFLTNSISLGGFKDFTVTRCSLVVHGRLGHKWALFHGFHSGCACSPRLVVIWVLLQLNFQFVLKKQKKKLKLNQNGLQFRNRILSILIQHVLCCVNIIYKS